MGYTRIVWPMFYDDQDATGIEDIPGEKVEKRALNREDAGHAERAWAEPRRPHGYVDPRENLFRCLPAPLLRCSGGHIRCLSNVVSLLRAIPRDEAGALSGLTLRHGGFLRMPRARVSGPEMDDDTVSALSEQGSWSRPVCLLALILPASRLGSIIQWIYEARLAHLSIKRVSDG